MKLIGKKFKLNADARTKKCDMHAGEELTLNEVAESGAYWVARLSAADGRKVTMLLQKASRKLAGFPQPPSVRTMERWLDDGVARSVGGARVEPDGTDPEGLPSWLLALGYI